MKQSVQGRTSSFWAFKLWSSCKVLVANCLQLFVNYQLATAQFVAFPPPRTETNVLQIIPPDKEYYVITCTGCANPLGFAF